MNKAELENKHLAELHSLAAEAGVERYRMLTRTELIEQLSEDGGSGDGDAPAREPRPRRGGEEGGGQRSSRSRRRRRPAREREEAAGEEGSESTGTEDSPSGSEAGASEPTSSRSKSAAEAEPPSPRAAASESESADAGEARPRRRRRRRSPFGRRGKQGVTLQGLLLPPEPGRQAVLFGESREACTALLRAVAADLAEAAKGPDPVALLIDPSPEELADWKREAPQAEIVAAGQPRHADDALGQAKSRAEAGEDVILLVDSLTRLGEAYADPDAAKQFFDAGRGKATGSGSLTVVAALERLNA